MFILCCSVLLAPSTSGAQEAWLLFHAEEGDSLWMDGERIESPTQDVIRIWARERRAAGELSRAGLPIRYAITHRELNCRWRTIRLLQGRYYSLTGQLVESFNAVGTSTAPRVAVPGSVGSYILSAMCGPVGG